MVDCVGTRRQCAFALFAFAIVLSAGPAKAQSDNPFVIDEAKMIQQVSLAQEKSPLATPTERVSKNQLRISIRYLLVDDATRRAIYADLNSDSIRRTTYVPTDEPRGELMLEPDLGSCVKRLSTYGHVATCILDTIKANEIVKLATESPVCTVSQAPGLILQQNRVAEINDMVQRPLVVDVETVAEQSKPLIRLVNEGTRIRVLASMLGEPSSLDSIELTTEFLDTRILAVNSVEVLGLQDQPTTLQIPVCESTTVVTTERLAMDQLILIDPHIKKSTTIEVAATSMLGRLPVVGRAFTELESKQFDNHLIVLIKPTIYAP